jgi:hypothetical protein
MSEAGFSAALLTYLLLYSASLTYLLLYSNISKAGFSAALLTYLLLYSASRVRLRCKTIRFTAALLLLYCCFTAALLLLYCCFRGGMRTREYSVYLLY